MKRRLNILCIIVFIVLGVSLYTTGYQFGAGIAAGVNIAKEQDTKMKENENSMFNGDFRIVNVVPTIAMWKPDTIVNAKTGAEELAVYKQMAVRINKDLNFTQLIITSSCSLLNIFITIAALVIFVLLILSINKSKIFEWRNVHRLRWLGIFLIISFALELLPKITNYWGLKDVFALDNYILAPFALQVTDMLLGIACLIVAETFAIGLRMKEEQELTI